MTTFTNTLTDDLMELLTEMVAKFKLPKNRLMEKSLQVYLD